MLLSSSSSSVAAVSGPPHERFLIIGVDVNESNDDVTVGLVLPVTKDTDICLDGEGGFYISSDGVVYSFHPVSVQEMWSVCLSVLKGVCSVRNKHQQPPQQQQNDWVSFYRGVSQSSTLQVVEWLRVEDALSSSQNIHQQISEGSSDHTVLKNMIRRKLQEILVTADLDNVTSIQEMLKMDLASSLEMSTSQYRQYLDEEMIMVMRQMDNPSQILDFLYLGSEWNASNLEELQKNGVGYILNVTKEIDNFFPGMFKYCNVRVYDYEETELIKHWNSTYKFIDEARRTSSKILVHCKMGVSRSASTVIAYLMKGHQFTLEHAYQMVKQRRSCVQPNPGFMKQLIIYQGILDARSVGLLMLLCVVVFCCYSVVHLQFFQVFIYI
ncbi:hypothetical protein HELRODRAFT_77266 [Helobdella robusta]|uniref:protein-serine/threonine phosphatase n=1 Tax=Helobdella robusta TaxID=6412 RepID=T1G2V3_HELRO|nr:hypothetical protein HELRODRAFT_77266 [Helobdella robusta]ESO05611.1 hypothetical protein HELRODRAFT_77266 [Helobdella robusta]